jgi:large subunit ribosomal protein L28
MAKRCSLTGKKAQSGNNVSHSQRKTRRRFLPNVQNVTLRSDILGRGVSLKVTVSTLRTIEHNGGLDQWLLGTSSRKLTDEAIKLKKQLQKASATEAKAA